MAARTAACTRRSVSRSSGASRPASRPCRVHRYSEPPRLTASGPSERDALADALEPLRRQQPGILEQPHHADDGRGQDGRRRGLIVEGNVAADHRELERAARLGDALDGLARTARGSPGARGAEVQAVASRRAARHPRTTRCGPPRTPPCAAPRRGSRKTVAPVAVGRARRSARRVPFTRSTAASEPGSTSVLIPTCWSYWRNAHCLEAMVGEASSSTSASP